MPERLISTVSEVWAEDEDKLDGAFLIRRRSSLENEVGEKLDGAVSTLPRTGGEKLSGKSRRTILSHSQMSSAALPR